MAKVRQECKKCAGKGVTPRTNDDPLAQNPFTKRILDTYPNETCSACGGNRYLIVEVDVVENPASS